MKTKIIVIVTASLLVAAGLTHHHSKSTCPMKAAFSSEAKK